MNNLQRRLDKIEERRGMNKPRPHNMVIHFVGPTGQCSGKILIPAFGNPSPPRPYGDPLWIDDDGNPIPPPDWTKKE